jgi:hypothetical protein
MISPYTNDIEEPPRTKLINNYLSHSKQKSYLEIGVRCGAKFFRVNASKKIGVDPDYFFSKRSLLKAMLYKRNWFLKMYKLESDSFFSEQGNHLFNNRGLDVVFIDGMHTYDQSLKDATNSLLFLNRDGTIIFHDCNPLSEVAAQPNIPTEKINWNGDVWKTIHHFRQYPEYFDCFTYDTDEGLGVLKWKGEISKDLMTKIKRLQDVSDLPYEYLSQNRDSVIGLRDFPY